MLQFQNVHESATRFQYALTCGYPGDKYRLAKPHRFIVKLNQRKNVVLIKDGQSVLDEMITDEDIVKYYYYIPPSMPYNYTATVTVTPRTAGFFPNIYALRQDLINGTINYKSLYFPTMNASTYGVEQQFYQTQQPKYNLTFNVSAVNITTQIGSLVL